MQDTVYRILLSSKTEYNCALTPLAYLHQYGGFVMKKVVVVGGSNGIGLAIAKNFISRGYYAVILDKTEPDNSLDSIHSTYYYCNLLDFDEDIIQEAVMDPEVDSLMITAGFGRVADFEYLHPSEIRNLMTVNAVMSILIIRYFYGRIKCQTPFYCGIMGSVAGWVSSPMFSVYAASKAAICRFVESVNIELEVSGSPNRILNCSPGSIKGTKFNGQEQDFSLVADLANHIVERMFKREIIYIPNMNVYKSVFEQYKTDAHAYGLHSYNYKLNSGRAHNEKRVQIGYLSGTFDLFHVGHLNLLKRAKQECDYLIVGVHPSAAHKGKETFIPFEERMQIVGACKYVDKVVQSCPEDCDAWELYHYNKLFVGSDYKGTERFNRYERYFKNKDVKIIYFPYTKGTSSTQIRKTVIEKTKDL